MPPRHPKKSLLPLLLLALGLAAGPALADKPDFAGGPDKHGEARGKGHDRGSDRGSDRGDDRNSRDAPRGQEKQDKRDKYDQRGGESSRDKRRSPPPGPGPQVHGESYRFHGDQRVVIRDYYTTQFRSGRCPPGLARKHNGCVPPGHERVWVVGRPLPREVIYYELPSSLVIRLGQPPAHHRYVRIGADILLIAIGTGMVVDAIEDLGDL